VLELMPSPLGVVSCMAAPEALDALIVPGGVRACRAAPDELLLVGAERGAHLVREVADRVAAGDADALVLDATEGWAGWTLAGDGARDAFAFISRLVLPVDGFVQGDVAHVHAKVLAQGERIDVLVPAYWGEHLRRRIAHDCPGVLQVSP
jgi:hypothetical protein